MRNNERKAERAKHPFITRFLRTTDVSNREIETFITRYIISRRQTPWRKTIKFVEQMPYSEFLKTTYWKAISEYVKNREGYKCSECGSKSKLHVHHNTYLYHGNELNHLESLVCLCEDCHKKIHCRKVE